MLIRMLLLLVLMMSAPAGFAATLVRTPITDGEKLKLDAFIAGRDIRQIDDFVSPNLDSIGPVEHFIFRKAVLLGGLDAVFEDYIVPNSARARQAIRSGVITGGGAAQWHYYYQKNPAGLLESDAVISQGEYEKGLYTTREKSRRLKISQVNDLRALAVVSSNTWLIDWTTLQALPFAALHSGATRPAQFRIVQAGRADVTLQDFAATPDMSIEEEGVRLYPVPGVKIGLDGSRHFLISKAHPDGAKVFAALERGLKIMRENGEIKRILLDSGVVNKGVQDWILLNPHPASTRPQHAGNKR